MEHCKTCVWWHADADDIPADDDEIKIGWGQCQRTYGPHAEGSLALSFTFDPYVIKPLFTHPDFGCVQHVRAQEPRRPNHGYWRGTLDEHGKQIDVWEWGE